MTLEGISSLIHFKFGQLLLGLKTKLILQNVTWARNQKKTYHTFVFFVFLSSTEVIRSSSTGGENFFPQLKGGGHQSQPDFHGVNSK